MGSMPVRNIPEKTKQRFREIAAAHGLSMEEHLRRLITESVSGDSSPATALGEEKADFGTASLGQAPEDNWVLELIRLANGAGEGVFDDDGQPLREFDL